MVNQIFYIHSGANITFHDGGSNWSGKKEGSGGGKKPPGGGGGAKSTHEAVGGPTGTRISKYRLQRYRRRYFAALRAVNAVRQEAGLRPLARLPEDAAAVAIGVPIGTAATATAIAAVTATTTITATTTATVTTTATAATATAAYLAAPTTDCKEEEVKEEKFDDSME